MKIQSFLVYLSFMICAYSQPSVDDIKSAFATSLKNHFKEFDNSIEDSRGISAKQVISNYYGRRLSLRSGTARFSYRSTPNVSPVYYECKKSSIVLRETYLTSADKANGIELKVTCSLKSSVYRSKKTGSWSDWVNGTPIISTPLIATLLLKDGVFTIKGSTMPCVFKPF